MSSRIEVRARQRSACLAGTRSWAYSVEVLSMCGSRLFLLFLSIILINGCLFIPLLKDIRVAFSFSVTTNATTVKICTHVFVWIWVFILLGEIQVEECLGIWVYAWPYKKLPIVFQRVCLKNATFLPVMCVNSNYCGSLSAFGCVSRFWRGHSNSCTMCFNCGFNLHFLKPNYVEHFFVCLLTICISSLLKHRVEFFAYYISFFSYCT